MNSESELKLILKDSSIDFESRKHLFSRYKSLREIVHDCLERLEAPLEESTLENLFIPDTEKKDYEDRELEESSTSTESSAGFDSRVATLSGK